jgi:hypothetical protein
MTEANKNSQAPEARCQRALDKSRNERQKSLLLTEVTHIWGEKIRKDLCDESARLVTESKLLCEESKAIKRAKKS